MGGGWGVVLLFIIIISFPCFFPKADLAGAKLTPVLCMALVEFTVKRLYQ